MNKLQKVYAGLLVAAAVLAVPSIASAQTATPTEQITTLAEDGLASVTPIILAVAGVAVGIAAVRFGVRFVMRAVSSGGRAS